MTEYEHYGESLNTHPDYFLMKRAYEEKLLIEELETTEHFAKFVTPVAENTQNITVEQQGKQELNEEINENETNVLRCAMGPVRERGIDSKMERDWTVDRVQF